MAAPAGNSPQQVPQHDTTQAGPAFSQAAALSPQTASGPAERLCSELRAAWQSLEVLTNQLRESSLELRAVSSPDSGTVEHPAGLALKTAREQYEASARKLILTPVEQYIKARPIRRSLEAMRECDEKIAPGALKSRAAIDKKFQRVLAQTSLDICEPWRIYRGGNIAKEWSEWEQRWEPYSKEASTLLERYTAWASGISAGTTSLPTASKTDSSSRDIWWRQQRAVNALLEMEAAFGELGITWFDATENFFAGIVRERNEILARTSQALDWIRGGAHARAHEETPDVVSYDERTRTWVSRIEDDASHRLPEKAELVLPARFPVWRSIAARQAFLSAFAAYSKAPMSRVIEKQWSINAGIVREASRAREIVEYWREASAQAQSDAVHNATVMLDGLAQTPVAAEELDATLADLFRRWNEEGSAAMEAAETGWVNLIQRQRGRRLLRAAARIEEQRARHLGKRAIHWVSRRWDLALESIGARIPSKPSAQPVIRRTTLRDTLSLPATKGELPELYRLLFRLAPVEDRRFLVGRDQELAGIEQALRDWDEGRFAACLVVGARGSGKTSLLNCAASEIFSGRTLIRGQFEDRILTPESIDGFVRKLVNLAPDADLEAELAATKRVLMIEESERTYLRKIGGFEGVRHLIHLIHRTAASTLWVIVTNEKAFRVLDAGAELGRVFSHRINAMSVSRDDLERAILERHRLSGLQLEFAPPPPGDPRIGRMKGWLGLHDSAQKLFFESLYQQSGGVFRSAFELWLSSIERIEGETIKIRQPLDPAFSEFRNELEQQDHFTLLAIHEHGSLLEDELAEVLCETRAESRSRMDRLWALGLIENDPEHPGLRIRPEAQRFTNDLLRRANLT